MTAIDEDDVFAVVEASRFDIAVEPKAWMKDFRLVTGGEADLTRVVDLCIASGRYGADIETTGLDKRVYDGETVAKIVGFSLCPDGKQSWYFPLRHQRGTNVGMSHAKRELQRLFSSPAISVWHNAGFDHEFLEHPGGEPFGNFDDPKKWEDTFALGYFVDSTSRELGLKAQSKALLGREMIELEELFPPGERLDFSLLDPAWEPVGWYAGADALNTLHLFDKLYPAAMADVGDVAPKQDFIYTMEKLCTVATRWMERNRIHIDREKVKELIILGNRELLESMKVVYTQMGSILGRDVRPAYFKILCGEMPEHKAYVFDTESTEQSWKEVFDATRAYADKLNLDPHTYEGRKAVPARVEREVKSLDPEQKGKLITVSFPQVYDISSPPSLGLLLFESGLPGLKLTDKSKQVSTRGEDLDEALEGAGEAFAFAKAITTFRGITKALSTNLFPLLRDTDRDSCYKSNFKNIGADTGRFRCAGGSVDRDGASSFPTHSTPGYCVDKHAPMCVQRQRECFSARGPNRFIVAVDYSGVELRIICNLSRERKWLKEFFRCSQCEHTFPREKGENGFVTPPPPYCPSCGSDRIGDLHTLTGISVYGEDAPSRPDWKALRGNAKGVNFTLCFGGSGNALVNVIGCDVTEGYRIKDVYDASYLDLAAWWRYQKAFGKKHGFVHTAFGRRRVLHNIRKDPKDKALRPLIAADERVAINQPVQGTSADITKISMGLIYREIRKRGWEQKVMMVITMHDELVFDIEGDVLEEALEMITETMARNKAVKMLDWPVPLTFDVEFGSSWAVPYDLKKVRAGKQDLPSEVARYFPKLMANLANAPAPEVKKGAPEKVGPKVAEGVEFHYRIGALTAAEMDRLAAFLTATLRGEKPSAADGSFVGKGGDPTPPVYGVPVTFRVYNPEGREVTGSVFTHLGIAVPPPVF